MRILSPLFVLLLATALTAQITQLPGTGCSNQRPCLIGGTPAIGQTLLIASDQFPCNSPRTTAFVSISVSCQVTPAISWSCIASLNPCVIMAPADVISTAPISNRLQLAIPNDPNLVGATFCVQGGCFTTFLPPNGLPLCFSSLSQVALIQIQ